MVGSDDGETPLFTGVDDSTDSPTQADPLKESDTLAPDGGTALTPEGIVKRWAGDLTYKEAHAFIVGFAPWFMALVTGHPVLLGLAATTWAMALGLTKVENKALRYLVMEPHYCIGGGFVGWIFGASWLAWAQLLGAAGGVIA